MPFSIGIDIVEIDRVKRVVETRGKRFLDKVYAPEEVDLCSKRADSFACLAARFAAKEAMKKAVSGQEPIAWRDIVVVSANNGSPALKLAGEVLGKLGGKFSVSLSHSRDYAVAVILWERTT